MKDNVILQIKGLHSKEQEDDDSIEVFHTGVHFVKNGRHYIKYQESMEKDIVCDNLLKISSKEVEFVRKGAVSTNMVFTAGQKNVSYYDTPFGAMMMAVDTTELDVIEKDDVLSVSIKYSLDMNYEHMSDSEITIKIREAQ